jgi:hypothetical protein
MVHAVCPGLDGGLERQSAAGRLLRQPKMPTKLNKQAVAKEARFINMET